MTLFPPLSAAQFLSRLARAFSSAVETCADGDGNDSCHLLSENVHTNNFSTYCLLYYSEKQELTQRPPKGGNG